MSNGKYRISVRKGDAIMPQEAYNPRLKALILQVVDNQIRDNNPPITKATLKRLMKEGYSMKKAKERIGYVVVCHIYDILKNDESFDEERYTRELMELH